MMEIYRAWRDRDAGALKAWTEAKSGSWPSHWEGVDSDYVDRILQSQHNRLAHFGVRPGAVW